VVGGAALPWVFLAVVNLALRTTPIPLQGRVSAAISLALFGPQAPALALGSVIIAYASYREIYLASAAASVAIAAWLGAAVDLLQSRT
jgi:hypothetical protein